MTSVPPSRRRPVPTTPTVRPRVAGLRKRPEQGTETGKPAAAPEVDAVDTGVEDAHGERAGTAGSADSADSTGVEAREADSTEVLGLIEPREDAEAEVDAPEVAPRPRPTGRRKRTGEAVAPSVLTDADPKPGADPEPGARTDWAARFRDSLDQQERSGGSRRQLVLPIALVVLAALLVGLGVWLQRQAGGVRYNEALVDSAGTTEVAGQTREAVEKAFSYNFADVSATEKAANELLVGKAKCQYNAIFGPVRTLAPEQKLVVTVKAVSSGVTSLDGDHATVLLFLDQVTTRTTDNQSGGGIAMMRVSAQKVDGRWKVDNMEMFGQSGDQAAETAKC
jgi:Mce-associated membrane protein